jgi:phosphoribosylanthranilate isomerase
MVIKVCGMKIPENIKAVATLNIQYMGFIFYAASPRYVGTTLHMVGILNKDIKGVGVFVNEKIEVVQILLEKHQLPYVQLHGIESPDYCQTLKDAGVKVIKAFRLEEGFDFQKTESYLPVCDYFLFDTKGHTPGGTGAKFNWALLQQYHYDMPFFLSGGIGPQDVEALLQFKHPQLHALDLNSRFEIEPGLKDIKRIHCFLEKINHLP